MDESNAEETARHGVTEREVLQVLDNRYVTKRNRRGHKATHILIGRTNGGRCLAIPVEPTHEQGVWRPATAWPCGDRELASLTLGERK